MPELPEVEIIKLQLKNYIEGSVILDLEVFNPKYEISNKSKIINSKILNIRRFAKQLSIDLSNNYSILIHVKMTGQLIFQKKNEKTKVSPKVIGGLGGKHTHLVFHLNNGDLFYNDVRQFGWFKLIKSKELEAKNYAPEPFKDLTFEYFRKLMKNSRKSVKILLLDQSKIGGIGNIYANDALWLSKINPKRSANTLSDKEAKLLFKAIRIVLKAGLKYGGASELAFVAPNGREGEYQNHTLAYGRQGEICKNCKFAKIEKYFLGGRGTYWCSNCQK